VSRVYRCTFQCTYGDGTLVQPSFHYQTDVPPLGDEPDPDDVASGLYDLIGAAFVHTCPGQVTVNDLVCAEQTVPPAIGVVGTHHIGLTGTTGSSIDDAPRALVPLINIHTGTRSRSSRGHTFLASPGDLTKISSRQWTSAFMSAIYTPFAALLDDSFDLGSITPTHVNPVIYSRTRHLAGSSPYTFRVTSAVVNPRPTWLRSRLSSP